MEVNNNKSSLWNNPMVQSALYSMTEKDKQHYKDLGESLYKDINFETSEIQDQKNVPVYLSDAVNYIVESVKSGLHPSMLNENEKVILNEFYGEEWYKKFGYVKEDLIDIVTLKKDEKEE